MTREMYMVTADQVELPIGIWLAQNWKRLFANRLRPSVSDLLDGYLFQFVEQPSNASFSWPRLADVREASAPVPIEYFCWNYLVREANSGMGVFAPLPVDWKTYADRNQFLYYGTLSYRQESTTVRLTFVDFVTGLFAAQLLALLQEAFQTSVKIEPLKPTAVFGSDVARVRVRGIDSVVSEAKTMFPHASDGSKISQQAWNYIFAYFGTLDGVEPDYNAIATATGKRVTTVRKARQRYREENNF